MSGRWLALFSFSQVSLPLDFSPSLILSGLSLLSSSNRGGLINRLLQMALQAACPRARGGVVGVRSRTLS